MQEKFLLNFFMNTFNEIHFINTFNEKNSDGQIILRNSHSMQQREKRQFEYKYEQRVKNARDTVKNSFLKSSCQRRKQVITEKVVKYSEQKYFLGLK